MLITGANGHIGRRLVMAAADRCTVTAVVRSERARDDLATVLASTSASIAVVDYQDVAGLASVSAGCDRVVHLVGILKEGRTNRYRDAHEGATRALLDALGATGRDVRFVYLSILGAHAGSANACLASKGRAERMVLDAVPEALVLQVPMVLGEGDYAAAALRRSAAAWLGFTIRSASREQPVYAGDVVNAILAGLEQAPAMRGILRLAGPRSLSRAELIAHAAAVLGTRPRTVSLPRWLGFGLAWALESLVADPPLTRAMLEVLDHDDDIDPSAACGALGIELLSLDETLRRCIGAEGR